MKTFLRREDDEGRREGRAVPGILKMYAAQLGVCEETEVNPETTGCWSVSWEIRSSTQGEEK